MEQLEVLYQFETGTAFSELDSLAENQEFKQGYAPLGKMGGQIQAQEL